MTQTMQAPPQTAIGQPTYEITKEDKDRIEACQAAWKAYRGKLPKPLKVAQGQPDDNVRSNRVKGVVQAGKGFLFGKELEISVEENAPEAAQELLDKTWGRKEKRIPLLQKLAMNGATGRNAFLRIMPSEDDPDNPGKEKTYRLVAVDPTIVVGIETAPQDCETVLLYCLQYGQPEKIDGKPGFVWYREEIMRIDPDGNAQKGMPDDDDTWQIMHWTQRGQSSMNPQYGKWEPDPGGPIMWDYPFPPLFDCQNLVNPNDRWGEADVEEDLIDMNNALNLTLSSINRIEKIYGGPLVWAKGMAEDAPVYTDRINVLPPSPESGMGAVPIPNDVTNALAFSIDLRSDMDELTRVPGVATGRIKDMPRGNLSGIAIELLFQSLLMKTEEKRCTYGELIIDVSQAVLVLAGLANTVDDIDITLGWQDPLPHEDLPSIQAAVSLEEVGVSRTTRMRNLGYDPEEEAKLRHTPIETALNEPTIPPLPLPTEIPGAPLLPGQPPPAKPGMPAPGQQQQPQGGLPPK